MTTQPQPKPCRECQGKGAAFYGSALGVLPCRVCRLAQHLQARDLIDDPLPTTQEIQP